MYESLFWWWTSVSFFIFVCICMALRVGSIVIPLPLLSPLILSSPEDLTEEIWYLLLSLTIAEHNLKLICVVQSNYKLTNYFVISSEILKSCHVRLPPWKKINVCTFSLYGELRAPLPKILISNFHPKIDFARNSSINFAGQVVHKYEIISEKLSFFKILWSEVLASRIVLKT